MQVRATIADVGRPRLSDERRHQIVAAATTAITARGFDGVRLSDVAREAGVAVGTIQHYFGTRDALLRAAFLEANTASVTNAWAAARNGGRDPWERLIAFADYVTALPRWGLWIELWAAARRSPALANVLEEAYDEWRAPIVEAIEEGADAGSFRPAAPAGEIASAIVALVDGLGLQRALGIDWVAPERAKAMIVATLEAALPVPFEATRPALPLKA